MKTFALLVMAATLLSGCESMNDMVVRHWYIDRGLSSDLHGRITEGYRRRMSETAPAPTTHAPAPAFLDEG